MEGMQQQQHTERRTDRQTDRHTERHGDQIDTNGWVCWLVCWYVVHCVDVCHWPLASTMVNEGMRKRKDGAELMLNWGCYSGQDKSECLLVVVGVGGQDSDCICRWQPRIIFLFRKKSMDAVDGGDGDGVFQSSTSWGSRVSEC